MKTISFILISIFLFSCSSKEDELKEKKEKFNEKFYDGSKHESYDQKKNKGF